jgi:prephenate dehydrogenase
MSDALFRKACIVGLGLLGESLALSLRRVHPDLPLAGVDRPDASERSRTAGVVDESATRLADVLPGCDLVFLAVPVRSILELLPQVGLHADPDALITDVGSTKRAVCREAAALPRRLCFVGGHPMAGSADHGAGAPSAHLFEGATWWLCPPEGPYGRAPCRAGPTRRRTTGRWPGSVICRSSWRWR